MDDIAFASNDPKLIDHFKKQMQASFEVKLYGELKSFIRWSFIRDRHGIVIHQRDYSLRLLTRFGMARSNAVHTPLASDADLNPRHEHEAPLALEDHHTYRALVGGLAYLATCTRHDISFAISALSRHLHDPSFRHLLQAKRVLRYISGTLDLGIHSQSGSPLTPDSLGAYLSADCGGDIETRKSTTGFVITVNLTPVFWRSARQQLVTLSSAESEYVALSFCAKELTWLRMVFWEVCHRVRWSDTSTLPATVMLCDSSAAISIAIHDDNTPRTKHIDLRYHHIKDLLSKGYIYISKVTTDHQLADCLTKVSSYQVNLFFQSVMLFNSNVSSAEKADQMDQ